MCRLSFALIHLIGALVLVSGQEKVDSCIKDLSEVTIREINRARHHNKKPIEYVLCPNTLFSLTQADLTTGSINILTPNVELKCGNDGHEENNCAISGYDYQLRLPNELEEVKVSGIDIQNITIQGITFERATQMAISVTSQKATNVTFQNCVFREQQVGNYVVHIRQASGAPQTSNRRLQQVVDTANVTGDQGHGLDTLISDTGILIPQSPSVQLFFQNCSFESNTVKQAVVASLGGSSSYVEFTQCRFQENRVTGQGPTTDEGGSLLWFADASTSGRMVQNCFQQNSMPYTTVTFAGNQFDLENNYGTDVTNFEDCDAILRLKPPFASSIQDKTFECNQFDAATCLAYEDLIIPTSTSRAREVIVAVGLAVLYPLLMLV